MDGVRRVFEMRHNGAKYLLSAGVWTKDAIVVGECIQSELDAKFLDANFTDLSSDEIEALVNGSENAKRYLFEERLLEKAVERYASGGNIFLSLKYLAILVAVKRKQERPAEAIAVYSKWMGLLPYSCQSERGLKAALVSVGHAYCDLGDFDCAETCANQAERLWGGEDEYIRGLRWKIEGSYADD